MNPADYTEFLDFYKAIPTSEVLAIEAEIVKLSPFYRPGQSNSEQHATMFWIWNKYVKTGGLQ